MFKLTLDTNVIIGGLDGIDEERTVYNKLIEWHNTGLIEIAVSNRIEKDKATDKDAAKAYRHLVEATRFTEISSTFRIGVTQEHGILADESIIKCLHVIFEAEGEPRRRNTLWDIDHLYGHFVDNRDWFLTNDAKIWRKWPYLKRLRIRVSTPKAFTTAFSELAASTSTGTRNKGSALEQRLEELHQYTIDQKRAKQINLIIDHYLAVEQAEIKQANFEESARNAQTEIGQVVSAIVFELTRDNFIHNKGYALSLAISLYPKLLSDYGTQGAVYGETTEGLIIWIKELYNQRRFI